MLRARAEAMALFGRYGYAGRQRQGYLAAVPARPEELGAPNRGSFGHGFARAVAPRAPQVEALARPRLETERLGDKSGGFRCGRADALPGPFRRSMACSFLGRGADHGERFLGTSPAGEHGQVGHVAHEQRQRFVGAVVEDDHVPGDEVDDTTGGQGRVVEADGGLQSAASEPTGVGQRYGSRRRPREDLQLGQQSRRWYCDRGNGRRRPAWSGRTRGR